MAPGIGHSDDTSPNGSTLGSADDIVDAVHMVKNGLAEMITASGAVPTSTRETARRLNIDRNLVWMVTKIINSDDLLRAALDIPSSLRIEKLCQACLKCDAPLSVIDNVRGAMKHFEHIVDVYAGNREAFTDLVHGMVFEDVTARQEEIRKMVFRGNSSIWGVQAKVNFKTGICYPSPTTPGMVDAVRIGGLIGLKRLRPVPWPVFKMIAHKDDGSVFEADNRPLDPGLEGKCGLPLIRDFCSDPMPDIEITTSEFGETYDLMPGSIGKIGLVDCVLGDIIRNVDHEHYEDGGDEYLATMLEIQTPAEYVILDMFVHEALSHQTPPDIRLVDRLSRNLGYDLAAEKLSQLPLSSLVMALPPGLAGTANSYYPDYPKLLEFAYDKAGISAREFKGFRFMMRYPVVPSGLRMLMRKAPAR